MASKIKELKIKVKNRLDEIDKELNSSMLNNEEANVAYLKDKQLETRAMLRVINHIESNFTEPLVF